MNATVKIGASISSVMNMARTSNNGRLNSMALNASEIRCAEKAVQRGLLKMYYAEFPCYGNVKMFQLV